MVNYAVFIEPEGGLRQEIILLKNLVDQTLPGQKYCSHPPHCTIIFGSYHKPDYWVDELENVMFPCAPFQLTTKSFQVFYNDQPAGGGHTVVIRIENAIPLFHIQEIVGNVLSRHKIDFLNMASASVYPKGPLRTSMERYGFPFVGDHWQPHFSIASLKTQKKSLFLEELIKRPVHFNFIVNKISVWEIEGDQHNKLHTIHLKGTSTNATQS